MNKRNKLFYELHLIQVKEEMAEDAKLNPDRIQLPEAAALARLVEQCIRDKDYKIAYTDDLEDWDVIVSFGVDPMFGAYMYNDDEVMLVSTSDGIRTYYL